VQGTDTLLWWGEGMIQAMAAGAEARPVAEGARAFCAAENEDRVFVCYPVYNDAGTTDVCVVDISQTEALPIMAAQVEGYADSLAAVAGSDGLRFAILSAEMNISGQSMQVKTDLYATGCAYQKSAQLVSLDWDTAGWLPGETAAFEAIVANVGTEPITQLHLDIAGVQPDAQELAVNIAPGNLSLVAFSYVLPEALTGDAVVSITVDGQEADPADSVTVPLEFVDVQIEGKQLQVSGGNSLYLAVRNVGTLPARCSLIVHQEDEDGPVLFSQYLEVDAQTAEVRIVPMDEYLAKIPGTGEKNIFMELSTVDTDLTEENNAMYVVFRNLK